MKECEGLKDYLMDAMDLDAKKRFEAHLPDCKTCSTAVAEDRAIAAGLSEMPKVNAPANFVAAVMGEVAARRRSRMAWGVYGVAVLVVAVAVGMLLGGNVSPVAEQGAVILHSLTDFGASLYTVVHNISAVLFSAIPMGKLSPVLAGGTFLALCILFYKTAFSAAVNRR